MSDTTKTPYVHAIRGDGKIVIGTITKGRIEGRCSEDSMITVANCRQMTAHLAAWNSGKIFIEKDTSINGARIYAMGGDVTIGRDCMLSDGIIISASDQQAPSEGLFVGLLLGGTLREHLRRSVAFDGFVSC